MDVIFRKEELGLLISTSKCKNNRPFLGKSINLKLCEDRPKLGFNLRRNFNNVITVLHGLRRLWQQCAVWFGLDGHLVMKVSTSRRGSLISCLGCPEVKESKISPLPLPFGGVHAPSYSWPFLALRPSSSTCSVPGQKTSLHRKLSKPDEQSAQGRRKWFPWKMGAVYLIACLSAWRRDHFVRDPSPTGERKVLLAKRKLL